jgi:hypothetical protein
VIEKAKTACKTAGYDVADHFLDIRKMVTLGSGAKRNIDDMRTEDGIIVQHVKNNRDGWNILVKRNIKPETHPSAEDIKKIERRLISEKKKMLNKPKPLEPNQGEEKN